MDFDTESRPEREGGSPQEPRRERRERTDDSSTTEFDYTDPVQSFVDTATAVVKQPVGFFSGMRRQGDFVNPLVFALITFEALALAAGLSGLLSSLITPGEGFLGAMLSLVLLAVFAPVIGALTVFVSSGVYHLVAYLLVKPETSGFEATFRVLAYSFGVVVLPLVAVALVGWVPILGAVLNIVVSFAVTIYVLFLTVIGIREVHETTTGRAAMVMLIPSLVSFLIFLILLVAGAGAVFLFSR